MCVTVCKAIVFLKAGSQYNATPAVLGVKLARRNSYLTVS